jgi:hypothetical protein
MSTGNKRCTSPARKCPAPLPIMETPEATTMPHSTNHVDEHSTTESRACIRPSDKQTAPMPVCIVLVTTRAPETRDSVQRAGFSLQVDGGDRHVRIVASPVTESNPCPDSPHCEYLVGDWIIERALANRQKRCCLFSTYQQLLFCGDSFLFRTTYATVRHIREVLSSSYRIISTGDPRAIQNSRGPTI